MPAFAGKTAFIHLRSLGLFRPSSDDILVFSSAISRPRPARFLVGVRAQSSRIYSLSGRGRKGGRSVTPSGFRETQTGINAENVLVSAFARLPELQGRSAGTG